MDRNMVNKIKVIKVPVLHRKLEPIELNLRQALRRQECILQARVTIKQCINKKLKRREIEIIILINNLNKCKKRKRNRGDKQKMYIKMEDLNQNMLVIT